MMQLEASVKAELSAMKLHRNKETGGLTVTVELVSRVVQDKATDIFGQEFHDLVFGPMIVEPNDKGENGYSHPCTKLSDLRFVCEMHTIHIGPVGPLIGQPKIHWVKPIPKEAAAEVCIQIALPVEKPKLLGDLGYQFGQSVSLVLAWRQQKLDLPDQPTAVVMKPSGKFGNLQAVPTA